MINMRHLVCVPLITCLITGALSGCIGPDRPSITTPDSPEPAPDARALSTTSAGDSTPLVSGVRAASGKAYVTVAGGMDTGVRLYIDRTFTVRSSPAELQGQTYIRTADDDREISGNSRMITFDLSREAVVYVGYNGETFPGWLSNNGFVNTGKRLSVDAGAEVREYVLWARTFAAGEVQLGSNRPGWREALMYTVVVTPTASVSVSELRSGSGREYVAVQGGTAVGARTYIDRTFTFRSLPAELQGQTYIRTADDDQAISGNSRMVTFRTDQEAMVYVGYNGETFPGWLSNNGFVRTGQSLTVDAGGKTQLYNLWARTYAQGEEVRLGSNRPGSANALMYTVFVRGTGNQTSPTIQKPEAHAGGPYSAATGDAIRFDGSASRDPDGGTLSYAWDFGDGRTGTGVRPSHTYSAAGTYTVTLRVTNTRGSVSDPATATAVVSTARGPFVSVTVGWQHSCALTTDGKAWCWGYNALYGQLGTGTWVDRNVPTAVAGGLTFSSLSGGAFHTCGLTTDGIAYCWGTNAYGQLGDGTLVTRNVPTPVAGGLRFTQIGAGEASTCALTAVGEAYCWGRNNRGQLGIGTTSASFVSTTPLQVVGGIAFAALGVGHQHVCGVDTGGIVYCWGRNAFGQLGDGTKSDSRTPKRISGNLFFTTHLGASQHNTCAIAVGGRMYCWGDNWHNQVGNGIGRDHFSTPQPVANAPSFTRVGVGGDHACAATATGEAWCWGDNSRGQLGYFNQHDYNPATRIPGELVFTTVAGGGWDHSCALTTAGSIYCWGWNQKGQLGDGTNFGRHHPVQVRFP
jgi:alpha-tubulin suppressor-like RCC1 family protein